MTAMTPIGTRTLRSLRPFGRIVSSRISPTGSGSDATCRTESASCPSLAGVRVRRSVSAAVRPFARAASRSLPFAAIRKSWDSAIRPARSASAVFLAAAGATASASDAERARSAMAVISAEASSGMGGPDFRPGEGRPQRNSRGTLVEYPADSEPPDRDRHDGGRDQGQAPEGWKQLGERRMRPQHLAEALHRPVDEGEPAEVLDELRHEAHREPGPADGAHEQDHERRDPARSLGRRGERGDQHAEGRARGRRERADDHEEADVTADLDPVQGLAREEKDHQLDQAEADPVQELAPEDVAPRDRPGEHALEEAALLLPEEPGCRRGDREEEELHRPSPDKHRRRGRLHVLAYHLDGLDVDDPREQVPGARGRPAPGKLPEP